MSNRSDSNPHLRRVKVAVVGSGLAGLTAAYLLSTVRQRADIRHNGGPVDYEVHVFEKVCALPSTLRCPPSHSPFPYLLCDNAVVRTTRLEWILTRFHLCCLEKRGNGVLMCRCALSREASIPRDCPQPCHGRLMLA